MFEAILQAIQDQTTNLSQLSQNVIEALASVSPSGGSRLLLSDPIPNTFGSISDVHARIGLVLSLSSAVANAEPSKLVLVPKGLLQGLPPTIGGVCTPLQGVLTGLDQLRNSGGYGLFNRENFTLSSANGSEVLNFATLYQQIDSALDSLLEHLHRTTQILSPSRYDGLADVTRPIANLLTSLKQSSDALQTIDTEVTTAKQKIISLETASANLFADMTSLPYS